MLPIPNLRYWRQRRALSQVDLSERTGLTQTSIARIEKRKSARPSTVRKLAEALEVSVDDLMRETEEGMMPAA